MEPSEVAVVVSVENQKVITLQFKEKVVSVDRNNPKDEAIEDAFWFEESQHHLFGGFSKEEFNRNKSGKLYPAEFKGGMQAAALVKRIEIQKSSLKIKQMEYDRLLKEEEGNVGKKKDDLIQKIGQLEREISSKKQEINPKYTELKTQMELMANELASLDKELRTKANQEKQFYANTLKDKIGILKKVIKTEYSAQKALDGEIKTLEAKLIDLSNPKEKKQAEIRKLQEEISNAEQQYSVLFSQQGELIAPYLVTENYKEKIDLYRQLFRLCKAIADQVENNNDGNDALAASNAYKMLVLFEGKDLAEIVDNFAKYVRQSSGMVTNNVVHNALSNVILPDNGQSVTLDKWREFFHDNGIPAVKLFAIADKIEEKKAQLCGDVGVHMHRAPDTFSEANDKIKILLTYQNTTKNIPLAELCLKYDVPEETFNRCLEIERKQTDNLPVVAIDGSKVAIAVTPPVVATNKTIVKGVSDVTVELDFIKSLAGELSGVKKPAGSIKKVAAPKIKPNVTASSLVSQKPQATTKPATGYWLVKLPIEDPRAPILGHVTNCS
jgi:hypothetical protein